jgi:hypothetical protein
MVRLCEPQAAYRCHWRGSHKVPVKNNINVIYLRIRLTLKGILRNFLKEGEP